MRLAIVALVLVLGCQPELRAVRPAPPPKAPDVYELAFVRPETWNNFGGWMLLVMGGPTASPKATNGQYIPRELVEGVLTSNDPPVRSGGLLVRPPNREFRSVEGWQKFVWGATTDEVLALAPSNAAVDPETPERLTRVRWSGLVADLETDVVLVLFGGRLAAVELYPRAATGQVWEGLLTSKYGLPQRAPKSDVAFWRTRETLITQRLIQTQPVAWNITYVGWMFEHLVRNAVLDERARKAQQDL